MVEQIDDPTEMTQKRSSQAVRWRIVPGFLLAVLATLLAISTLLKAFASAYYNLKYGWIQVDPELQTLSQLAITPTNVLKWQCGASASVAAGVSAYACFYGKWQLAWIGTGILVALGLTANWIRSL